MTKKELLEEIAFLRDMLVGINQQYDIKEVHVTERSTNKEWQFSLVNQIERIDENILVNL